MAAVKVTRVLHHSVNVEGNLDESVDFYRRLLHLVDEDRPAIAGVDGHWFDAADVQIHLVDADAGTDVIQPTGPHVCFAVDDLDAAIAELEGDGIAYVRGAQGAVVQIWFSDPAGNTIEIQQERRRPAP